MNLYILKCNNFLKIGITRKAVYDRVAELQTGNPSKISVIGYWRMDNARRVERTIHGILEDNHVRGEWFNYSDRVISEVSYWVGRLGENPTDMIKPLIEMMREWESK